MKKFMLIAAFAVPFFANLALADDAAPAGGDKPAATKKKSTKKSSTKKTDKAAAPAGDDKAAAPANP